MLSRLSNAKTGFTCQDSERRSNFQRNKSTLSVLYQSQLSTFTQKNGAFHPNFSTADKEDWSSATSKLYLCSFDFIINYHIRAPTTCSCAFFLFNDLWSSNGYEFKTVNWKQIQQIHNIKDDCHYTLEYRHNAYNH